ncbi:hypothetical protein ACH5RR_001502 [Cinchona calisaya]|uniref:Uncharacterized protein n=1 Tax=Cinchona calisaya TaxID=153742 RepID=A0ABD3B409_9GENT
MAAKKQKKVAYEEHDAKEMDLGREVEGEDEGMDRPLINVNVPPVDNASMIAAAMANIFQVVQAEVKTYADTYAATLNVEADIKRRAREDRNKRMRFTTPQGHISELTRTFNQYQVFEPEGRSLPTSAYTPRQISECEHCGRRHIGAWHWKSGASSSVERLVITSKIAQNWLQTRLNQKTRTFKLGAEK